MKRLLFAACIALLATPALAQPGQWIGVWGAAPVPPSAQSRSFENVTLRQVIRLSATGSEARVRFTNVYGETPLVIGAATGSVIDENGVLSAAAPLTFSGETSATIPPGGVLYSDPVPTPGLAPLSDVAIDIYLPGPTGPCTCHPIASATTLVSPPGDHTGQAFEPAGAFINRAYVSRIEMRPEEPGGVIVTFGDSITDGTNSTPDTNNRWPDELARRLNAAAPQQTWGVVNAAISGNQVLSTGQPGFGEAALVRFDRDVLSAPGATHLVVLEGINDMGMNRTGRPTAREVIAGYQQIIARAHAHGIKVIGATLLPFEGTTYPGYFSEEGETRRQEINAWIREGGAFDAVIDFDAAVRDPENPRRMRAEFASPDWLHPNDAGYRAMGQAVDLGLFR